jgi:coatomer subunit beta
LADEEAINSVQNQRKVDDSFVGKLNHIVQLTGYSDPIYAESFVLIHKYDIQFDVLFINRSGKVLQNV